MSEPKIATDYSNHKRVVIIEHGRVRGEVIVLQAKRAWVNPLDLVIWDEARHSGRVLNSTAFNASVEDGVCNLPEHMIREDVRADVLEVIAQVKEACVAAVAVTRRTEAP